MVSLYTLHINLYHIILYHIMAFCSTVSHSRSSSLFGDA